MTRDLQNRPAPVVNTRARKVVGAVVAGVVGSVTIHVRNGSGDRAALETTPEGSRTRVLPDDT